ncbi:MAG TPA: hypothetical protein DEP28_12415 [Bacteroidetes bacterium]|nr:hypothetical protein [Bacteroidota bacterium]
MMKKIILIFLISVNSVLSQYADNPKSLSMGRTSVANSFQLDALNNNPANLVLNSQYDKSNYYFTLFTSAGFMVNSDFLSADFYNKYFSGNDGEPLLLSNSDKEDILSKAGNTSTGFKGNFKFFSLLIRDKNVGTFALSFEDKISGLSFLPKDALDVALYGNKKNSSYDYSEFDLDASWIRQLNISYAKELPDLFKSFLENFSFGVSVKPQFGYYNFGVESNNLIINTDDSSKIKADGLLRLRSSRIGTDNSKITFPEFGDLAGFGMGFDVGFNLKFSNKVNVGLSVTDIGWVNWYKTPKEYLYKGDFLITDLANSEQYDQLLNLIEGTETSIPNYKKSLPTTLRVGVNYKIYDPIFYKNSTERANITAEYYQGLVDNVAGVSTTPLFFLGGEYLLSNYFIPRTGIVLGNSENLALSLGFGLITDYVIFDFGTHNILSVFNINKSSKNSVAFSLKFKFD